MKEVIFMSEGCEGYLALGYTTKREALKAINRYDKKEGGDGYDYGLNRVTVYKYKRDGEDWYDWSGEQKRCPSCGAKRKGRIGYVGYI